MSKVRTGGGAMIPAVGLSLIGLGLSAILLQHHVSITLDTDPILGGMCEPVESASCDDALASAYGKIAGLPTALWGFFYFAALSAWFIVIGRPSGVRQWLHIVPLLATAVGTVGCLFLAVIMYTQLDKWCPLCAATHVVTALLFITTLALWLRRKRGMGAAGTASANSAITDSVTTDSVTTDATPSAPSGTCEPAMGHPSFRHVLIALLLAVTTSAAGWSDYQRRLEKAYRENYEKDYQSAYERFAAGKQEHIPITSDDPIRGSAGAPHTIVVFSDFQCPYCRVLELTLKKRLKTFPGQFRLVYKHFPMNKQCNKHINKTLHAASCAAAITAESARLVGGDDAFWKMHDELFADPKGFASGAEAFVKKATARMGMDHDALWKRINTRSAWSRVYDNIEQGRSLGIKATPVMYFDGRKMAGWGDEAYWSYLLRVAPEEKRPTSLPSNQ